jgi:hypothetical protein
MNWKPQVIRYADDIVVLHRDKTAIESCQRLTADWLADMGLELSPTKPALSTRFTPRRAKRASRFLDLISANTRSVSTIPSKEAATKRSSNRVKTRLSVTIGNLLRRSAAIRRHGKRI